MMKLSDKITELRKANGWSRENLAEQLNVSRQAISRWENGTALPDANNILQLSRVFNVTADYLLNEDYSNDNDAPCVKLDRDISKSQKTRHKKRFLAASILWLLCAAVWLIQAIVWLEVIYCILAVIRAILALINIILYERGKKTASNKFRHSERTFPYYSLTSETPSFIIFLYVNYKGATYNYGKTCYRPWRQCASGGR